MSKKKWPKIKPSDFMCLYKSSYYGIYGYIGEVDKYIDGKGYIDKNTSRVYICSKNKPPSSILIPVVKVSKDNEVIELVEPAHRLPPEEDPFEFKNLIAVDNNTIETTSSVEKELYDEQALADMNAATSMYIPTLNDIDDALKKCVKYSIIAKGVNVNRYKHSMGTKYGFTNLKAILENKTKMSITNFDKWMELENCSYKIILYDNGGDTSTPLRTPLVYSNERNRIDELSKDDIKQMIASLDGPKLSKNDVKELMTILQDRL